MGDIEKDPCHNPPNLNINRPKFQLPTSEKPPRLSQPAVNIRGREGLYHITQRNPTTCEYPSGTTSTRWLKTPSMYHISAYCGASFILMSCFPDMEPTTGLWRFCEVCVATFPCVSVFWLVGWLVGCLVDPVLASFQLQQLLQRLYAELALDDLLVLKSIRKWCFTKDTTRTVGKDS